MDAYQKVTAALEAHGSRRQSKDWNCPGPLHSNGDRRPSLSVDQGHGGAILCCQVGCQTEEIISALGLTWDDLFDQPLEQQNGHEVRYPYTDENGVLLFSKIRRPGKKFLIQHADNTWGIGSAPRVLYNLPALLDGIKNGQTVYVTEGEKDADNLRRLGLVATTNFDGAGKWRDEYAEYFQGADVTIIADRDEPGIEHAKRVHSSLAGTAASVRIVQSKTEGKGHDVTDHLNAGFGVDQLVPFRPENEITRRYQPVDWHEAFRSKPGEVNWLFPPLIEAGTLNVLFGLPGVGKSLLVLDMVLEILREGRNVTVFDEENRVDEVVERLEKFGVTDPGELRGLSWYSFPQLPPLDTPEGGEHLTAVADRDEPALIVLDTTTRMIEGDENNASTWFQLYRNTLVPLKKRGIAVLRLDHQGKDPSKGQRGSSAKDGDVDTIWRLKFADGGYLALEREKTRNGHGEEWMLVERLANPLRHVFKELDHIPVTPKIQMWADNFDRWGIPRDAGRPTLRAAIQEKTRHDDGIGTTLLAMVARYRKSLDSPPQPGYDPFG